MPTFEKTEKLVKEKITGFRKGTIDIPNFTHSLNVRDLLKEYGFDKTVQMAGLLHDIIEDGDMTLEELKELGYSKKVFTLVDLATHNKETEDKFQRRKDMMKRLEVAENRDARAVKLADICDNVNQCHLMPDADKKKRFLYEKCPYFVKQCNIWFGGTAFYQEFLDRYLKQLFRLLEWNDDSLIDGKKEIVHGRIRFSYDGDYFVKWILGKTYELYDGHTGKKIDLDSISTERLNNIVSHVYTYGKTTDEKTFYEEINKTIERFKPDTLLYFDPE